jgi:hypothetical protein
MYIYCLMNLVRISRSLTNPDGFVTNEASRASEVPMTMGKRQTQAETTTSQHRSQEATPAPLKAVEHSSLGQQLVDSAVMEKGVKPLSAFFQKFFNDWTMSLQAGALAYNLLTTRFLAISSLSRPSP